MFGAKTERKAWPVLASARNSVEMAPPMARHSVRLKLAAERMGCGKEVEPPVPQSAPWPQRIPCSPSLHHSKEPMSSDATPPEVVESSAILSEVLVIRATRSAARASKLREVLQKGSALCAEPGRQASVPPGRGPAGGGGGAASAAGSKAQTTRARRAICATWGRGVAVMQVRG